MQTVHHTMGVVVRKSFGVLICALVASCGGSDTRTLTEKYELQAQAEAWENHMPMGLLPGQEPPCTALIVRFSVTTNQVLPPEMSAKSVSLSKGAAPQWTAEVSPSETGLTGANTIEGVARGCKTEAFSEGDTLDVSVLINAGDEQSEVKTSVRLDAAS